MKDSDQSMSDSTPRIAAGAGGFPPAAAGRNSERVEWTGADIAVDDTEGA